MPPITSAIHPPRIQNSRKRLSPRNPQIGIDHHHRPNDQADDQSSFCADAGRYPTEEERAGKGHKLHHQNDLDEGALFDFQPAPNQRGGGKDRGDGDDGLDAVVKEQIGDQKSNGMGMLPRGLFEGLPQLCDAN